MDLKKKMKNFFTLTRKANGGFTLVELIVVIAILAILGGVAVPAYSGYVKKAERAADEQLLSALNTAFASACAINGQDHYDRDDVDVQLNAGAATVTVSDIVGFENAFNSFYEGGTFKVFEELFYNPTSGRIDVNVVLTFTFGDKTVTLSSKDVAVLSGDNAFSNRGSAALLEDVAVLENLLSTGIGQDVLDAVTETEDFIYALGGYLGLTQGAEEDYEAYAERVEAALGDDADSALYSAQIMYAASQAANATSTQITDLFTGTVTSNIEVKDSEGNTDYTATMANAALAYGMYTAYVQQYPDAENVDNFTLTVNSDEFATYYASAQGKADLEAYMAAMNMISDNTSNSEITSSILANGINGNTDLEALMKEVMGS